jgi:hypothetical protein
MKIPRVKRSKGPSAAMTEYTYRKKALPHLMKDFQGHCAYCLDPSDFRAPSQSHVEHFDCKIKGRNRNYYKNLMLACAACNLSKGGKPVQNPFKLEQRLINCTVENEFTEHIKETEDGQWEPLTQAGLYHLESIELREHCHWKKRSARKTMIQGVAKLLKTAVYYKTQTPVVLHNEMMSMIRSVVEELKSFPPLVIDGNVVFERTGSNHKELNWMLHNYKAI